MAHPHYSKNRIQASARRATTYRRLGSATRRTLFESLEPRFLLNVEWRNPADALDANSDTFIAASDALAIINDINAFGSRELPPLHTAGAAFVDISGDQFVAPA